MIRVLVLHNELGPDAGPDEIDVLDQAAAVRSALDRLGFEHRTVSCGLDLERLRSELVAEPPEVVFNLVESLGGEDRLLFMVPALLECLGIPYTGSSAEALFTSTGKLSTRQRLCQAGVPMPRLAAVWPAQQIPDSVSYPVIVKSTWQHGSPGLDASCILEAGTDLSSALQRLAPQLGGECLAEEYIDGRELNLGLLELDGKWSCLPPAEILFDAFPEDKPRIVGCQAKWQQDSFEYRSTPRSFEFSPADRALLHRAQRIALETVGALGLSGSARVDLRVGPGQDIRVLEANANPCLAPDAGFAAALQRAGIDWSTAVESMLAAAWRKSGREVAVRPVPASRHRHTARTRS